MCKLPQLPLITCRSTRQSVMRDCGPVATWLPATVFFGPDSVNGDLSHQLPFVSALLTSHFQQDLTGRMRLHLEGGSPECGTLRTWKRRWPAGISHSGMLIVSVRGRRGCSARDASCQVSRNRREHTFGRARLSRQSPRPWRYSSLRTTSCALRTVGTEARGTPQSRQCGCYRRGGFGRQRGGIGRGGQSRGAGAGQQQRSRQNDCSVMPSWHDFV